MAIQDTGNSPSHVVENLMMICYNASMQKPILVPQYTTILCVCLDEFEQYQRAHETVYPVREDGSSAWSDQLWGDGFFHPVSALRRVGHSITCFNGCTWAFFISVDLWLDCRMEWLQLHWRYSIVYTIQYTVYRIIAFPVKISVTSLEFVWIHMLWPAR